MMIEDFKNVYTVSLCRVNSFLTQQAKVMPRIWRKCKQKHEDKQSRRDTPT